MYKIKDCQFDYRYYADEQKFKTKEEIADELIEYHSIDFSGTDDKDNELSIYDYLDFWKIKTIKARLAWVLEYGEWAVEKI